MITWKQIIWKLNKLNYCAKMHLLECADFSVCNKLHVQFVHLDYFRSSYFRWRIVKTNGAVMTGRR